MRKQKPWLNKQPMKQLQSGQRKMTRIGRQQTLENTSNM